MHVQIFEFLTSHKKVLWASFFLVTFLWVYSAQAIIQCTSYICFDRPKTWTCKAEGIHLICHNKIKKLAKEAVIIAVAKETGRQDSVSQYLSFLKNKKEFKTKKGKPITSRVFHSKQRNINHHLWADGFHLASEIPNYYTRYLGSTKKGLAVLVTYTAHKKKWSKHAKDFNKSVQTLRFLNVEQSLRKLRLARRNQLGGKGIRDYLEDIIGDGVVEDENQDGLFGNIDDRVIGGVAGATVLAILFWRLLARRRRRKLLDQEPGSNAGSSMRKKRKKRK